MPTTDTPKPLYLAEAKAAWSASGRPIAGVQGATLGEGGGARERSHREEATARDGLADAVEEVLSSEVNKCTEKVFF